MSSFAAWGGALEACRSAGREILAYKGRSALSGLSLCFGVAAMLYTLSQIQGLNRRFSRGAEIAGLGRLEVGQKEGYVSKGLSPGLTWEDAKEIQRLWPELPVVYPMVRRWGTRLQGPGLKIDDAVIWATTEQWTRRDWVYKVRGRFFTADEVRTAAKVCVLMEPGGWVKKPPWAFNFRDKELGNILKRRDLLGRRILIEDRLFTVVGILKAPPRDRDPRFIHSSYGGNGDVLVPISAYQQALLPAYEKERDRVDQIVVDAGTAEAAGPAVRRLDSFFKARHRGEADYEIQDFRQIVIGITTEIRKFAFMVLAIGVVAVLAGGIGIMNVTLASVFSRIREIGIRRALGATRLDIVWQFVAEAVALGLLGGAAGTGLGTLGVIFLSPRADRMAPITWEHLSFALLVSAGTGFIFSIFPASRAAAMDPIEALRYE